MNNFNTKNPNKSNNLHEAESDDHPYNWLSQPNQ